MAAWRFFPLVMGMEAKSGFIIFYGNILSKDQEFCYLDTGMRHNFLVDINPGDALVNLSPIAVHANQSTFAGKTLET